ncbi:MAG: glycosyltransferase [Pseudomonadota bacterium]
MRDDHTEPSAPGSINGRPVLTLLVPTYRDDASRLIESLGACEGAGSTELIVLDDGTCDPALCRSIEARLDAYPGASRLIVCRENRGRAGARNALLAAARTDWVLFLDADMVPDDTRFVMRYLEALAELSAPGLVCGGCSARQTDASAANALHVAQATASECRSAAIRNTAPGRYVFTSNLLVHRAVFEAFPLDTGFTGWGWEDVDWGLRIAEHFPVRHIDNTASHLGMLSDGAIVGKYAGSGANFARLARKHPEAVATMPLFKAAAAAKWLGILRRPMIAASKTAACVERLPISARLFSLKLFRALVYSRHL